MKRILSGIQPTSHMHLGNYLGAVRNWVKMQSEPGFECLYCVVDLHAITVAYDKAALAGATREMAATLMAAGIDPAKSTIFVQSAVPAHSELMWLLSTMAQMGKLQRMTQFKEKGGKNAERVGLGLFAYPVLMAADILVYKGTHVPIGEDQKQHLELARDLASTFNTRYGVEFFPQPEPMIMGEATRVMSLRDGTKKMSKSDESDMTRINLTDDADTIANKIKKAKSDPEALPDSMEGLEGRPEAKNLLTIYAALAKQSLNETVAEFAGKQFSEFKPALADLAVGSLAPMTKRMNELMNDPAEIDRVIRAGNEKAGVIAEKVVAQTREIMGFWK
ncbi:MAG: tryptophan--tRNA ligase [Alphaproteobacteria bacterium]|nr:tryptophan--tRNA ligase [Alphaproteobacteria bacterium]